ncbi:MAG: hypothetical protein LAO05_08355 [Acidobacteriia bacterium]|nr:hypothetical protein [Terriglobia bacterium]
MAHELLIIGAETRALKHMAPVLRRAGCNVSRIPRADHAAALLQSTRFDLILVRYPVEGLTFEEFVAAVRAEGSPCRDSGLLMLVDDGAVAEAGRYLKRGVNRIVGDDAPSDRLLDAIADLLGVAPRHKLRAAVQLELWLRDGGRRLVTVTENLSATGMLVRGGTEFPVGALLGFELLLPGQQPVAGSLLVARHTDRLRERVEGFGGRIISFSGDGQERLSALLATG